MQSFTDDFSALCRAEGAPFEFWATCETKHAVTCPLSHSNITPLAVLRQVESLINSGLSRVEPLRRLGRVITDRWWSTKECLSHADDEGSGLVTWGKETQSVRTALDALGPVDEQWEPVWASQEQEEEVVGWLLDTEVAPLQAARGCVALPLRRPTGVG